MTRTLPAHAYQSYGSIEVAKLVLHDNGVPQGPTTTPYSAGSERRSLVISHGNPYPYRSLTNFYQVTCFHRPTAKTGQVSVGGPMVGTKQQRYDGLVATHPSFTGVLPNFIDGSTNYQLLALSYGSVGWNLTKPSRPIANINVMYGELRELPSVPLAKMAALAQRVRGRPLHSQINELRREVGSEYLNLAFGWSPLIDDLRKLAQFQQKFAQRMASLRQYAGGNRTLRREITLVDTTSTTVTQTYSGYSGSYCTAAGTMGNIKGTAARGVTTSRRIWYSAGYRLLVPDLDTPAVALRWRRALLGGTPTIEQVWALTPWSWLAGWFSSVNHALANMADPLREYFAARYAFVMIKDTTTNWFEGSFSNGENSFSVRSEYGSVHQFRSWASPFGWGLTWDGLSPQQVAIAAALGISRT